MERKIIDSREKGAQFYKQVIKELRKRFYQASGIKLNYGAMPALFTNSKPGPKYYRGEKAQILRKKTLALFAFNEKLPNESDRLDCCRLLLADEALRDQVLCTLAAALRTAEIKKNYLVLLKKII